MVAVEHPFFYDLAEGIDFEEYCYSCIGDRRNEAGEIPFLKWEEPDDKTHLFTAEQRLKDDVLQACGDYMSSDQMEVVQKAMALSFFAHQHQYRDTIAPYSTHFLKIARTLAKKRQTNEVTIASALLHDTIEDTFVTKDLISKYISSEVAQTVDDLSKLRGRYTRREIIDLQNRIRIITSYLDNPRAAIIKVYDRLHNMRTIGIKKDILKKLNIINETQQIIIPIAKRLGLFEEAHELEVLCLKEMGDRERKIVEKIEKGRKKLYSAKALSDVFEEMVGFEVASEENIHVRAPNAADIYRIGGGKDEIADYDFYYNIDIVLPDVQYALHRTFNPGQIEISYNWVKHALDLENSFLILDDYELLADISETQFVHDVRNDLVDSLSFSVRHKKTGRIYQVNIYPRDAYLREQVPMTYLYYQKPPLPISAYQNLDVFLSEDQEIVMRQFIAYEKLLILQNRYAKYLEMLGSSEVDSYGIQKLLEPRTTAGFIQIIGVDETGREGVAYIPQGTTVMDYIKLLFSYSWPQLIGGKLNGESLMDNLGHILQPQDRIQVFRDQKHKEHWHPKWIHCFKMDTEGSAVVRARILEELGEYGKQIEKVVTQRQLLEEKIRSGKYLLIDLFSLEKDHEIALKDQKKALEYQVEETGIWRIEKDLDRPLRVGLSDAMPVIQEEYPQIPEIEFFFKVGLGEVDADLIKKVATIISPKNNRVVAIKVIFEHDKSGQMAAVTGFFTQSGLDVSLPEVVGRRISPEGKSSITVYVDPDSLVMSVEQVIDRMGKDPTLQQLGRIDIRQESS